MHMYMYIHMSRYFRVHPLTKTYNAFPKCTAVQCPLYSRLCWLQHRSWLNHWQWVEIFFWRRRLMLFFITRYFGHHLLVLVICWRCLWFLLLATLWTIDVNWYDPIKDDIKAAIKQKHKKHGYKVEKLFLLPEAMQFIPFNMDHHWNHISQNINDSLFRPCSLEYGIFKFSAQ